MLKVKLMSNHKTGAEASDATFRNCPGQGGMLHRNSDGEICFNADGGALLVTNVPDQMTFFMTRQGYAKEVRPWDSNTEPVDSFNVPASGEECGQ